MDENPTEATRQPRAHSVSARFRSFSFRICIVLYFVFMGELVLKETIDQRKPENKKTQDYAQGKA
jgi:hypothetical protein